LSRSAKDRRTPIIFNPQTNTYELVISKERLAEIEYCIFCGGRSSCSLEKETCQCGTLGEWADDPNTPITYDAQLNEFHLQEEDGYRMIWYCLVCGGATPESKRGELFVEASEEDITKVQQILGRNGAVSSNQGVQQ